MNDQVIKKSLFSNPERLFEEKRGIGRSSGENGEDLE